MNKDNQLDSQTTRDQPVSGLMVPADLARESLPLPPATIEATAGESEQPATPMGATTVGDAESRSRFAEATHQYIRDNIKLADQKATFFFTGATALLAFFYKSDVSGRWIKPLMQWNILDTIAFLAMVALAVGAFTALLVVIPRTSGSRRGFIFWEAVAEYETGRQYADELWMLSPASLFQVKAEHCFDLARVCRRKYKVLRCALWICAVGLAASLILFLTAAAGKPPTPQAAPYAAHEISTP